jgi:DNA uptake protein ComE-like DNA-binding protein
VLIELNSADTADLMALRGIGRYYAGKIIRYRERLGGFISPEQLLEIDGVDSARFCSLREQVWTDTLLVRKFNLNSTPFKDYLRHPYFEYHLVKAIFRYKDEHKTFHSVGDLRSIPLITPPLYDRIRPYLEASSLN